MGLSATRRRRDSTWDSNVVRRDLPAFRTPTRVSRFRRPDTKPSVSTRVCDFSALIKSGTCRGSRCARQDSTKPRRGGDTTVHGPARDWTVWPVPATPVNGIMLLSVFFCDMLDDELEATVAVSTDPYDSITAFMADTSDPYPFYARKRNTQPVWRGTVLDHQGLPPELVPAEEWTIFDYQTAFASLRDDKTFSSAGYDQTLGLVLGHMLLAMHGQEHHDHRSLVAKAFRKSALAHWEPAVIKPVCDSLVDSFKEDGQADLVGALTFEFPTRVTAAMLGLPPEDLEMFRDLSFDLISIATDMEKGFKASVELGSYFLGQIEQRRNKPSGDMIGDLVAAEIDGQKLDDEAIIAFLRLLLPAGIETTYRSAGNLLLLLLKHQSQLRQVEGDRSLLPAAIEEGLRYETPMVIIPRTTTAEVEINGQVIPAGASVNLCAGSANRDENRWPDAEKFDIHRDRQPHVTFGQGIHTCLGMHLARVETQAMLTSLLDRVTDLRLSADVAIEGLVFRSPSTLPVTFRPRM